MSRFITRLGPTEQKILELVASGLSSKEVAENLVVSKRMVDFHLANIYDKLQVVNRLQAVRVAMQHNQIPPTNFFFPNGTQGDENQP